MSSTTTTTTTTTTKEIATDSNSDRLKLVQEFDELKIGVKGLVDRGLSTIPSFFVHQDLDSSNPPKKSPSTHRTIPVIDFSLPRNTLVREIQNAASSIGFFQIVNHGIPLESIKNVLNSITSFNELPETEKMKYYSRDSTRGAVFSTNFDLYQSKAASWRDTLQVRLSPSRPDWDNVPGTCREAIMDWDREAVGIGEKVMELLCEGLGMDQNVDALKKLSCLDGRVMAAHYYPYCPQPELTAGLKPHTDPGLITVLVQNEVPGLQVKDGEEWVEVEPVEGAVVINIGDVLQIMSNDEYKSVEHRVIANPHKDARVSVAIFFNPSLRENTFGPLPELLSDEKPARYRQFTFEDYIKRFFSKELDGETLTNFYRV